MSTFVVLSTLTYGSTLSGSTIFYQSTLSYDSTIAYQSTTSGGSTITTSTITTTSTMNYYSTVFYSYNYTSTISYSSTLIYYNPLVFPSTFSVPPSNFFTVQGLPGWLNANPTYKQYFINNPKYFPYLLTTSTITEYVSSVNINPEFGIYRGYKIQLVTLPSFVTMSSQDDSRIFREHVRLFRQVYEHNSNAWVKYVEQGVDPVYYRFPSSSERTRYLTARGTIFKMYPFDAISSAKSEAGSSLGWVFPFPF